MSDSVFITTLRKFEKENPFKKIVKAEISYGTDESIINIFYDDKGILIEHQEIIKYPQLSDENITSIKKRAKIFDWMDLDKARFIIKRDEPDKILIIYDDDWVRDIFIINKFKGKAKRFVESKQEMTFSDLILFLLILYPANHFYHDYVISDKKCHHGDKIDLNKKLFLLHFSSKYNGILPDDWLKDYEINKSLNFAELWESDAFLPDINIKDPIVFDAYIVDNAAEMFNQERY
ncbi:MAG: hypothetical protein RBQ97_05260 [Acholeplasma sp.]|nr:hypothetical protein [Acholeplasma sp.]